MFDFNILNFLGARTGRKPYASLGLKFGKKREKLKRLLIVDESPLRRFRGNKDARKV